jgi:hypothetical protein
VGLGAGVQGLASRSQASGLVLGACTLVRLGRWDLCRAGGRGIEKEQEERKPQRSGRAES